ncbi:MAG: hypothetical protein V1859_02075 [archaeon]
MKKITIVFVILVIALSGFLLITNLKFLKNRITGLAELSTSAIILQLSEAACEADFVSGWNLISIPCVPTPTNISEVLLNILPDIISVHEYYGIGADPWKAYNPSLPGWVVQDLTKLDRKKGYWMNMAANTHYYYNSSTATPNILSLANGWNLVGYPLISLKNISDAMLPINGSYDIIVLYNATDSADYWKEYTWNESRPSGQDLYNMTPYYGYWIYSYGSRTLMLD